MLRLGIESHRETRRHQGSKLSSKMLEYEKSTGNYKVFVWLMTNDIDQKGYYISTKNTLTTMKFYDVDNCGFRTMPISVPG